MSSSMSWPGAPFGTFNLSILERWQTRYKPWPIVAEFLSRQPVGSLGLDAGSGNGKYLHGHNYTTVTPLIEANQVPIGGKSPGVLLEQERRYLLLGLDRSLSLLSLSRQAHSDPELLHGDCLSLPFRATFSFDFAISIATLHHLSTHDRRLGAMKLLLAAVQPTSGGRVGRLLVFVWAHEQGEKSRRMWAKGTLLRAPQISSEGCPSTSAGEDAEPTGIQDVLVPWVLNAPAPNSEPTKAQTYNRYYHLFRASELVELVRLAAESLDLEFLAGPDCPEPQLTGCARQQRAGSCMIKRQGWEADNWWLEAEVKSDGS